MDKEKEPGLFVQCSPAGDIGLFPLGAVSIWGSDHSKTVPSACLARWLHRLQGSLWVCECSCTYVCLSGFFVPLWGIFRLSVMQGPLHGTVVFNLAAVQTDPMSRGHVRSGQ